MRASKPKQVNQAMARGQNYPALDSAGEPMPQEASSRKLYWAKLLEDHHMHASLAFVNAAGTSDEDLRLLHTLLSTAASESSGSGRDPDRGKSLDKGKSKDEHQAEQESKETPISKPGGFQNDPKDPANPNEVRERTLKKIKR
jgi:hypothetical protein